MSTAEEPQSKSPRLDRNEMDDLVRRLYDTQMERAARREEERRRELERLRCPPKRIKKEEEEVLVRRIYDQQLERFRISREERERRIYEETHRSNKMPEADIQDQVDRIYGQEIAKSKARREELQKRYLPEAKVKTISKEQLKESVERLSHVDYAKRDEELFKKHVYPYDPPRTKISPSEVEAMANRLSKKGDA